jgi:ATP-binding cassette, subfamily G (WHITE), eye pigment precursor transporter
MLTIKESIHYKKEDKVRLHVDNKVLESPKKLLTLTWENVNVHTLLTNKHITKNGNYFSITLTLTSGNLIFKIIVNGIAKPGQLVALMGASGAGKTTLLNTLNFKNSSREYKITGDIKVNGRCIKRAEDIASISGYVQQDDLFIGTLTVREHLEFQVMLRLTDSITKEQKLERVEQVLLDLNLKRSENNLISGISFANRRYLSFASEILTNPSILFCDEPTSGLDSFMAMAVVEAMKKLASHGRTVICTIHQPSTDTFKLFDVLYMMAEGRLAYTGELNHAIAYFSKLGYTCPANYNPAEFYIQILAIMPNEKDKCLRAVHQICDKFAESKLMTKLMNDISESNQNHAITGQNEFNINNSRLEKKTSM